MEIKNDKGITLLIAVLTAGLLLSVSLSIFNIAIKELTISSSGRDSHISFYAADAGAECALYWDWRQGAFNNDVSTQISCAGQDYIVPANPTEYPFTIELPSSNSCATVIIYKNAKTVIESRGYNICGSSSSKRTERGIKIEY